MSSSRVEQMHAAEPKQNHMPNHLVVAAADGDILALAHSKQWPRACLLVYLCDVVNRCRTIVCIPQSHQPIDASMCCFVSYLVGF